MEEKSQPGSFKEEDESLDFVQMMLMGDQPWWKVKCHPHDAVDEEQIINDRKLDSPLIQVGRYSSVTVFCLPLLTQHCVGVLRREL